MCPLPLYTSNKKNNKRRQHKRQHDGWDVNLWKYEQESKQAKARHGKPRQARQARKSQAKPSIDDIIEALGTHLKNLVGAL